LGALSLKEKWLEHEAAHSPSKVGYAWSYDSTLPYTFIAWCLVKNKDNFHFTKDRTFPGTY
jgi:hypothetical protein